MFEPVEVEISYQDRKVVFENDKAVVTEPTKRTIENVGDVTVTTHKGHIIIVSADHVLVYADPNHNPVAMIDLGRI